MSEKPAVYHPSWIGTINLDGFEIVDIQPQSNLRFEDFNPVIVFGGSLGYVQGKEARANEAIRREREISNSLSCGNIVCLTYNYDDLTRRVGQRIKINPSHHLSEPRADIIIKRSEFSPFLKKFGGTDRLYKKGDFDDIICETENGYVVGFTKKIDKGAIVVLPCHISRNDFENIDIMIEFLLELLNALEKYKPKIQYKPPNWIDTYRFPKETPLISEIEEFQAKIDDRKELLKKYLEFKEVLWFRNDELIEPLMNFFKSIGFKTKRDEIFEEDFWIMERDNEVSIVEVKALDKNLKRFHISQLDMHRGAREKADDFPALMIVNSFNKANSLTKKDKNISPNEIKKAVKTNVLIIRTLDLCNAFTLIEKNELIPAQLMRLIKEETGWLKITESGFEIKKNG